MRSLSDKAKGDAAYEDRLWRNETDRPHRQRDFAEGTGRLCQYDGHGGVDDGNGRYGGDGGQQFL